MLTPQLGQRHMQLSPYVLLQHFGSIYSGWYMFFAFYNLFCLFVIDIENFRIFSPKCQDNVRNFRNLRPQIRVLTLFITLCIVCICSHCEACSYKKSTKKVVGYRKSVQKEPSVKRCLLILDLKPLRSQIKGKHSIGREFQSFSCARKETFDIDILVTSRNGDIKIMQTIRITSRPPSRKRKQKQLSQF